MALVVGIFIGSFIGMMLMACVAANRITEVRGQMAIQQNMIKQREVFIQDQRKQIKGLEQIVNSLKEDNASVLEEAYKTAKRTKKKEVTTDGKSR